MDKDTEKVTKNDFNRRQSDTIKERLIEVEIKLGILQDKQDRHFQDLKNGIANMMDKYDKILLGDGLTNPGLTHEFTTIVKLFNEHTASDERSFAWLRWAIITIGAASTGQIIMLIKLGLQ